MHVFHVWKSLCGRVGGQNYSDCTRAVLLVAHFGNRTNLILTEIGEKSEQIMLRTRVNSIHRAGQSGVELSY